MTSIALPGVLDAARDAQPHPATRTVFRFAAAVAVATVATGAINSATGSGFACSTWPGCHAGHFVPAPETKQWIEFGHRLIAALSVVGALTSLVLSRRLPRTQKLARTMPFVAIVGIAGSATFGAMTVLNLGLEKELAVLDLTCALTTMVAMTLATLSLERGAPEWTWTPLSRLATGLTVATMLVHLLGMVLAGPSSFTAVVGWPLWHIVDRDGATGLQVFRFGLAAAIAVGIVVLAVRGWHHPQLRTLMGTAVVLLVLELAVGQWIVTDGLGMWRAALYAATAALLLFCLALAAGRSALDRL